MEWMALLSTCMCHCCGSEYSYDDDCQFNWILCWLGWYHGFTQRDDRELLRYPLHPSLYGKTIYTILPCDQRQRLISGWALVAGVFASLFVGVQVMFEIREDERRRGINLRC